VKEGPKVKGSARNQDNGIAAFNFRGGEKTSKEWNGHSTICTATDRLMHDLRLGPPLNELQTKCHDYKYSVSTADCRLRSLVLLPLLAPGPGQLLR